MSQRPFWISLIQWTLWAFTMAGIAFWISKARRKSALSGGELVMKYPFFAMVLAFICVIISGGLVALTFVVASQNAPWWTTAIFGVMFLGSVHFVVECFVAKYHLSPDGLRYVSVFTGERHFRWDELKSLKYADSMKWFVLKNSRGEVARISVMMIGLPAFARLLMERARHVDIEPATIPILRKTAQGEPPGLF
jgi:hypothetical protein